MGRSRKNIYCFLSDENAKFYKAVQQQNGSYAITFSASPFPISCTPPNLLDTAMEFKTSDKVNGLIRTITYPLDFIKDGAAILRHMYYTKKGIEQKCYLTIVEWDGNLGYYVLSYNGRIDFKEKDEDPKSGRFTVPVIDDSAWGILSKNAGVQYSIECNATNPKAIKVLIDGITLLNKYTFQTVQANITDYNANQYHYIPFVLVNEDGDSAGIIAKSQSGGDFQYLGDLWNSPNWFMNTSYAINNVRIFGTFVFSWTTNTLPSGGLIIYFRTSLGQQVTIFSQPAIPLVPGMIYKVSFDFVYNLAVDERIFFIAELNDNPARLFTIIPIVTNIYVTTKTVSEPFIAYGLRAIDLVQELVLKATEGRYTINSEWLAEHKYDVCLSGNSIRGIDNAKIQSNFEDFFKTFDDIYWMALRIIKGALHMEKFIEVYGNQIPAAPLIDLGEAIDVGLKPAFEYYANRVKVGSPKQDLRHPSGRLEFNSENSFSMPFLTIDKELDLVSRYRLGCFEIMFLVMDYKGQSTQDNNGDNSTYVVKITDEQAVAVDNVETFENINVNSAPLNPIIKSPLNNDRVTFDKPTIKGISLPSEAINIYVDSVLDGGTVADVNGNWVYEINTALQSYDPGVETGIHIVEATYTNLAAPKDTITITVDTTYVQPVEIIYPQQGDSLYNNKPLVKGVAQAGTNIDISLDGIVIASVVTDNSGKWEFKIVTPFTNAAHILSVNALIASVNFDVDSAVAHPLITYIGSELDGFPIFNNLPLIQGVALPNTQVTVWLNYISYGNLGIVVADANGNWSLQVVPVMYNDPPSGLPVVLAPIRNGVSVVSTSLINFTVGINTRGYKLSRPVYSSITGVTDNTVFNTEYSPKRMMIERYPLFAAMLQKQPMSFINFQTADKNGNLVTILNGVSIAENADIPASSLGNPMMILEWAKVKCKALKNFSRTLDDFSSGGVIKFNYRGTSIYALPIGGMRIENLRSTVQEWSLLLSPLTSYTALLNLYKNGLTIRLNERQMYHSDYNTLHFVDYNFQQSPKYNFKTIYQDRFESRNEAWLYNPDYIQKVQFSDPVRDQIVSNGVSGATLKLYRCYDGVQVDSKNYNPVGPAPIPLPDIVSEAVYDMSLYPAGQYFFVMWVGETPVSISERIETKEKWEGTILFEGGNSINLVGFFYSTGIKTILRVEGLIKKLQPSVDSIVAKEESGDTELLYSQISKKRTIRFGTASGLPDYLYLKCAAASTLDELEIEGVGYTLEEDEQINPSDDVDGVPLYYYDVKFTEKINPKGKVFPGEEGDDTSGIVLVVDAEAFGMPFGSLMNIQLPNE